MLDLYIAREEFQRDGSIYLYSGESKECQCSATGTISFKKTHLKINYCMLDIELLSLKSVFSSHARRVRNAGIPVPVISHFQIH